MAEISTSGILHKENNKVGQELAGQVGRQAKLITDFVSPPNSDTRSKNPLDLQADTRVSGILGNINLDDGRDIFWLTRKPDSQDEQTMERVLRLSLRLAYRTSEQWPVISDSTNRYFASNLEAVREIAQGGEELFAALFPTDTSHNNPFFRLVRNEYYRAQRARGEDRVVADETILAEVRKTFGQASHVARRSLGESVEADSLTQIASETPADGFRWQAPEWISHGTAAKQEIAFLEEVDEEFLNQVRDEQAQGIEACVAQQRRAEELQSKGDTRLAIAIKTLDAKRDRRIAKLMQEVQGSPIGQNGSLGRTPVGFGSSLSEDFIRYRESARYYEADHKSTEGDAFRNRQAMRAYENPLDDPFIRDIEETTSHNYPEQEFKWQKKYEAFVRKHPQKAEEYLHKFFEEHFRDHAWEISPQITADKVHAFIYSLRVNHSTKLTEEQRMEYPIYDAIARVVRIPQRP